MDLEERTERQWFVKGRTRGDVHRFESEDEAREFLPGCNPGSDPVVVYRDVTYGPMVEAEQ